MTIDGRRPDARALREQAAHWFARMRGPDADRPAFEAWLAADPLHREAYSRIAEMFSLGKALKAGVAIEQPALRSRSRPTAVPLVAGMIVAVGIAGAGIWTWRADRPSLVRQENPVEHVTTFAGGRLQTAIGQIRVVRLADGSAVTLDTSTMLHVSFDAARRELSLTRGRARFDVAHDARPFTVAAGGGRVTAHGTLFDVGLRAGGAVDVRLLRGAIDVALPRRRRRASGARVERLTPGQQVVFTVDGLSAARPIAAPIDLRWPAAELDCDHVALSTVVAAANRYSPTHLVLADPTLGALRISGTFRIDDPVALSSRLALLFDLQLDRSDVARIELRR